ncbi:MAG: hypothetical protein ACREME_04785 [Gemmatimonadales bacterium]
MNRRLFGALGVIGVLITAAGCKEDPLSDLDGNPAALVTDFSYLQLTIADTLVLTASVLDARATPLVVPITFRACSGVVTTAVDTSYHPVPPTSARALVVGVTYGSTCVVVEAGALADTVQVGTFPASIVIFGPDTVVSGVEATYTYEYRDRAGDPVSGVPAPAWTVSDTLLGAITATGGALSPRDTGFGDVKVTGDATTAAGVSATMPVVFLPAAFDITIAPNPADPGQVVKLARDPTGPIFDANTRVRFGASVQSFVTGSLTPDSVKVAIPDVATGGALSVGAARLGPEQITQSGGLFTVNTPALLAGTITPSSGAPAELVTIKRGGGDPAFDANTRVYFAGVRTIINVNTPDSLIVAVPGIGSAGAKELRMTRLDAADLARRVTFTADTGVFAFADPFDDVNNDPATAPVISADGDYFVVVSGNCVDGVGGAGSDCDDFFTITNSTGALLSVTVQLDWMNASDLDILWCNEACDAFVGNFDGATGDNPEASTVDIPAGTTWRLWINLFDPDGTPSEVVRVRVSGLP